MLANIVEVCCEMGPVWRPGMERRDVLRFWKHVHGGWPVVLTVLVSVPYKALNIFVGDK